MRDRENCRESLCQRVKNNLGWVAWEWDRELEVEGLKQGEYQGTDW